MPRFYHPTVLNDRVLQTFPNPASAKFLFETSGQIIQEKGCENFENVYSGINASGINFTYREFDPKIRSNTAFFQNLTYEPGAKEIAIKNIVVGIDQANP